jgi:flagellar hook-basal body complex protein FliE
MNISTDFTTGNVVNMKTSHPLHFGGANEKSSANNISGSFADMLNGAISKVNNLLNDSDNLTQKMIDDPESVEIHNVMIASQKAEIALNFTKAVRDEVITAYRDLSNLR